MASNHIVDVTESDFEYEVIAHSHKVPVVVDFWAEWCGPCRILGPILETLAQEAGGTFRLAKVDVDENPSLARRFNVSGIPAVKAFRDGQVVSEFFGAVPEGQVRDFLRALAPSSSDLNLEKGESLLSDQRWEVAEEAFRQVLDERPDHPAALLGLAKSLLGQGRAAESLELLIRFPASREYPSAEQLRPLAQALRRTETESVDSEDFREAAYQRSLRLVQRGNIPAAMDGILDILREDKGYRNDEPRKVMLGLFELLGEENPLTRQYRSELASTLF